MTVDPADLLEALDLLDRVDALFAFCALLAAHLDKLLLTDRWIRFIARVTSGSLRFRHRRNVEQLGRREAVLDLSRTGGVKSEKIFGSILFFQTQV